MISGLQDLYMLVQVCTLLVVFKTCTGLYRISDLQDLYRLVQDCTGLVVFKTCTGLYRFVHE